MNIENYLPSPEQAEQLVDQALNNGFEQAKGRLPSDKQERGDWIKNENGADVISAIQPIAFAVEAKPDADLTDPDTYLRDSVEVSPVVNPLFHAVMLKLGATPNGPRSYEISAGKGKSQSEYRKNVQQLTAIMEVLPGSVCYPHNAQEEGERKGFHSMNDSRHKMFQGIYCLLHDTSAGEEIERSRINTITERHPVDNALGGAAIIVNSAKGRVFIKVCTNKANGRGLLLSDEQGTPCLDRLRASGRLEAQETTPDRAVSLMETAEALGYPVLDPNGHLAEMREHLRKMVVAQRVSGAPGQGRLVVGDQVNTKLGEAEKRLPKDGAVRVATVSAAAAGEAVKKAKKAGAEASLAPEVEDIIAMAAAKPADGECGEGLSLRDYQREAVGLHLSTQIGYLQACSVGLGKTAITLRGMAESAKAQA